MQTWELEESRGFNALEYCLYPGRNSQHRQYDGRTLKLLKLPHKKEQYGRTDGRNLLMGMAHPLVQVSFEVLFLLKHSSP